MSEKQVLLIRDWVKGQVSPSRFLHIQGVALTAQRLAKIHHLSSIKAGLASWLHDCAKELPRVQLKSWIRKGGFRLDRVEEDMPVLWHPHAGAAIAKVKWGIKETDILDAIQCHTLGRAGMGPMAQLLFVSDFIEPGRTFPGVERVRTAAKKHLKQAVLMKASMTISFLLGKGMKIHPRLLETWNSFLKSPKMPE
jgi:predicted HD superfamily hydrolase involved in NAD metabolism